MESILPPSEEAEMPSPYPVGMPVSQVKAIKSSSTSAASIISLILGVLSIVTCCGFFCGIPAFFIGHAELKSVDAGKVAPSNRPLAKIGMILGAIGTVISCLVILAYILFFAFGMSSLNITETILNK